MADDPVVAELHIYLTASGNVVLKGGASSKVQALGMLEVAKHSLLAATETESEARPRIAVARAVTGLRD